MNDGYLRIPEIEKETSIPSSTIRRYLEQHNHTLRTKKTSRGGWLLKREDLSLIREIRTCYERKMSFAEVEDYLLQSGQPLTITIDDEREQVITPANAFMQLAEEVQRLQQEVSSTNEQLASAHEEIKDLKKTQENASEQQMESINKLTENVKSIGDGIGRLERERQKREEQSFWSRLFGN